VVTVASKAAIRKDFLEFMFGIMFVAMVFADRGFMDWGVMDWGFCFCFQKLFPEARTPLFLGNLSHRPCQCLAGLKTRSSRLVSCGFARVTRR
jgi:hypothetical protein